MKFLQKNYRIGKAIGLPDDFLALKAGSKGGGVIQVLKDIFTLNSTYLTKEIK